MTDFSPEQACGRSGLWQSGDHGMEDILIALYYIVAIVVIVMHYIGALEDRGLEWIVYVVAVLLFPMLYFAYLP